MSDNEKVPAEFLPVLKFTAMCNGIPIAHSYQGLLVGVSTLNYFNLDVIGNGRYKSTLTIFSLTIRDVQWIRKDDLAVATAGFSVDGRIVGDPTQFLIQMSEYPQAPLGLLHWLRQNEIWENGKGSGIYERFSLVVVKA